MATLVDENGNLSPETEMPTEAPTEAPTEVSTVSPETVAPETSAEALTSAPETEKPQGGCAGSVAMGGLVCIVPLAYIPLRKRKE